MYMHSDDVIDFPIPLHRFLELPFCQIILCTLHLIYRLINILNWETTLVSQSEIDLHMICWKQCYSLNNI